MITFKILRDKKTKGSMLTQRDNKNNTLKWNKAVRDHCSYEDFLRSTENKV